jgi:hypothetical protein
MEWDFGTLVMAGFTGHPNQHTTSTVDNNDATSRFTAGQVPLATKRRQNTAPKHTLCKSGSLCKRLQAAQSRPLQSVLGTSNPYAG